MYAVNDQLIKFEACMSKRGKMKQFFFSYQQRYTKYLKVENVPDGTV